MAWDARASVQANAQNNSINADLTLFIIILSQIYPVYVQQGTKQSFSSNDTSAMMRETSGGEHESSFAKRSS
jgi:hypothetical protein